MKVFDFLIMYKLAADYLGFHQTDKKLVYGAVVCYDRKRMVAQKTALQYSDRISDKPEKVL